MKNNSLTNYRKNKPAKIGVVGGVTLYECPVHGDEVPMLFNIDGLYVSSSLYNEPDIDAEEVREIYDDKIKEKQADPHWVSNQIISAALRD